MIERARLDGILFAIMGDTTLVEQWWQKPNAAWNMRSPQEVFDDDPESVRDYVFRAANLDGDYY